MCCYSKLCKDGSNNDGSVCVAIKTARMEVTVASVCVARMEVTVYVLLVNSVLQGWK